MTASPNRDKWLELSRISWEALGTQRGNQMRREDEAKNEGPIFDAVSVFKVKKHADTGKIDRCTVRHNVDGNRGQYVLKKMNIDYGVPKSSTVLDDVVVKMIISDAAGRRRTKTKADVSSAYTNASTTRGKRFLRCPATCQQFDEDGTPLVLELGPPLFGEPEAGYEWQMTLEADLKEFGWTKVENVECLWRLTTATSDALVGSIVDDLLFSESSGYDITDATIAFLRKKYSGVKAEHEPTSFAGYKLETSADFSVCTISMPDLIEEKMKEHCPELIPAKARAEFKAQHANGGKLEKLADSLKMEERPLNGKMTKHGKRTQQLTGCLRYFMRASAGELNVLTHRLSCVQACAPPEAVTVGLAGMIMAYESRERGITYSADDAASFTLAHDGSSPEISFATGFPRDAGIHAVGDCTWGDRNVYALLVMMNHGAILTETKKMGPVDSSAEGEGITTSKCAEITDFIREAARGMGILGDKPTVIRSDNASSVRVANDPKSAGRLRHAMRRFAVLQERVKEGKVKVVFVPDAQNASDFMTKWVPASKLKASVAYTSNEAAKRNTQQAKKTKIRSEVSMLEVSVIEIEHVTMSLRSGKSKVAKISRDMHPYIQYPLGAGYLNAGLPPAAPPPIAAQAAAPPLIPAQIDAETAEEEDEYADYDQGDRLHYDSDHLGSNSDTLDHMGRGQRAEEYDPKPAEPHRSRRSRAIGLPRRPSLLRIRGSGTAKRRPGHQETQGQAHLRRLPRGQSRRHHRRDSPRNHRLHLGRRGGRLRRRGAGRRLPELRRCREGREKRGEKPQAARGGLVNERQRERETDQRCRPTGCEQGTAAKARESPPHPEWDRGQKPPQTIQAPPQLGGVRVGNPVPAACASSYVIAPFR